MGVHLQTGNPYVRNNRFIDNDYRLSGLVDGWEAGGGGSIYIYGGLTYSDDYLWDMEHSAAIPHRGGVTDSFISETRFAAGTSLCEQLLDDYDADPFTDPTLTAGTSANIWYWDYNISEPFDGRSLVTRPPSLGDASRYSNVPSYYDRAPVRVTSASGWPVNVWVPKVRGSSLQPRTIAKNTRIDGKAAYSTPGWKGVCNPIPREKREKIRSGLMKVAHLHLKGKKRENLLEHCCAED
jgi:hypothetical protein